MLQSYTYRPEQVVAGIFMMARTSPRAHELISKDASCKIYLSQDSSSFENNGIKFSYKLTLKELSSFRSTMLNANRMMHSTPSTEDGRGICIYEAFVQFHSNSNNGRTKLRINPRSHYRRTRVLDLV